MVILALLQSPLTHWLRYRELFVFSFSAGFCVSYPDPQYRHPLAARCHHEDHQTTSFPFFLFFSASLLLCSVLSHISSHSPFFPSTSHVSSNQPCTCPFGRQLSTLSICSGIQSPLLHHSFNHLLRLHSRASLFSLSTTSFIDVYFQ